MKSLFIAVCLNIFAFIYSNPIQNAENPMEVEGMYQGDIAGIDVDKVKGLSQVPTSSYGKWTAYGNGVVPYVIDSNVYTTAQLTAITSGMRLIEDQTRINGRDCIKFVPRTTEATYLRFHSGSGCWSYVGKQSASGAQLISIKIPNAAGSSNCAYTGIVAHELTHALGFWHEQSRHDRDSYIRINYANIIADQAYNFDKMTTGIDTLGTPYDLYSLMHYEWNAFSSNGQATITALNGAQLLAAWQKTSLTDIDVQEIRKYYNCA